MNRTEHGYHDRLYQLDLHDTHDALNTRTRRATFTAILALKLSARRRKRSRGNIEIATPEKTLHE